MQTQGKELGKQLHLPFHRAFTIAVNNIRLRLGRSMITASGIFLGIAFLSYVLTLGVINNALQASTLPEERMRQTWLVGLALMMSTVGITNSMLMSVTERYKEIGTMKCLGALDRFVVTMFILEGMMMGVMASILGVIVGGGITLVGAAFNSGWRVFGLVGAGPLFKVLAECVIIGSVLTFLATLAPAQRAAKMPPAAALRMEI